MARGRAGACGDVRKALAYIANKESRPRTMAAKKAWENGTDGGRRKDAGQSSFQRQTYIIRGMLRELEKAMPDGVMVSTDIGNICSVSNSYLRFDRPRSMLAAMSFGNCGYAFPTVVGAKVAAPDRPAVAYVGDGAWGMSFGELQTCVRGTRSPPSSNNGSGGSEKRRRTKDFTRTFLG